MDTSRIESRIDQQQLFQLRLETNSSRRQEVVRERAKAGDTNSSKAHLAGKELEAKKAQVDGVDRDPLMLLAKLNEALGSTLEPDIAARAQQQQGLSEVDRFKVPPKIQIMG